jgi:hypothetical protein
VTPEAKWVRCLRARGKDWGTLGVNSAGEDVALASIARDVMDNVSPAQGRSPFLRTVSTTDRASTYVQVRMMMRVRRRSACMVGMAIAVPGGTAQSPTAGRVVIASVAPFRRLVSVVGQFVDPAGPQRRHPVLFPVPVVASRWSRRRAG